MIKPIQHHHTSGCVLPHPIEQAFHLTTSSIVEVVASLKALRSRFLAGSIILFGRRWKLWKGQGEPRSVCEAGAGIWAAYWLGPEVAPVSSILLFLSTSGSQGYHSKLQRTAQTAMDHLTLSASCAHRTRIPTSTCTSSVLFGPLPLSLQRLRQWGL